MFFEAAAAIAGFVSETCTGECLTSAFFNFVFILEKGIPNYLISLLTTANPDICPNTSTWIEYLLAKWLIHI